MGINSRLEHVEEWINNLKDRVVEITWSEQQKDKRMKKNEDRDLWDNIKHTNICIIMIPEGEETEDRKPIQRINGWKLS